MGFFKSYSLFALKYLYETYGVKLISVMGLFRRGLGVSAGGPTEKLLISVGLYFRAGRTSCDYCFVGVFFPPSHLSSSRCDLNTRLQEKCTTVVLVNICLNTGMAVAV